MCRCAITLFALLFIFMLFGAVVGWRAWVLSAPRVIFDKQIEVRNLSIHEVGALRPPGAVSVGVNSQETPGAVSIDTRSPNALGALSVDINFQKAPELVALAISNHTRERNAVEASIFVTSLFSGFVGKRSYTSYKPWLRNLFSIGAVIVFYGDSVTISMAKSVVAPEALDRILFIAFDSKQMVCNSAALKTHYADIRNTDQKFGHTFDTFCAWHQKIVFLRDVASVASHDSAYIFWIDAGAFRINSQAAIKRHFPSYDRVNTIPRGRFFVNMIKPLQLENTTWDWNHTVVMSARIFGGCRDVLFRIADLYFAELSKKVATTEAQMLTHLLVQQPDLFVVLLNPVRTDCAPSRWDYVWEWFSSPGERVMCSTVTPHRNLIFPSSNITDWMNQQSHVVLLKRDWADVSGATSSEKTCAKTLHGFNICWPQGGHGPLQGGSLHNHWELTALVIELSASPRGLRSNPGRKLFVDVGMNLGFYTLLARRLGHPTVGFEIQQNLHRFIKASFEASIMFPNGTSLFHMGAGEQNLLLDLVVPKGPSKHENVRVGTGNSGSGDSVYITRLDDQFDGYYVPPDSSHTPIWFMKIDVEGAELPALQGALRLFESHSIQYLVIEIGQADRFARYGKTLDDAKRLLQTVQGYGYRWWAIEMWRQPCTKFFQPSSPQYSKLLQSWPSRFIQTNSTMTTGMAEGCPASWCHLQNGRTSGFEPHSTVRLVQIVDIDMFVDDLLALADFNLFCELQ